MKKTLKKHWVNGYQVRGGWHKTLTLSLLSYAVMFSWGNNQTKLKYNPNRLLIEFYKLI